MKKLKAHLCRAVLLSLLVVLRSASLNLVSAATNEVTIISVSATLNTYTMASGSTMGGTVLYVSGVNFSPNAADIQIFIGPYPCILVAEGATVSTLSCTTTPMLDPS